MIRALSHGRELANIWVDGKGLEVVADHMILDGVAVRCDRCDYQLFQSKFAELDQPEPNEYDLRDPNFIILCAECLRDE